MEKNNKKKDMMKVKTWNKIKYKNNKMTKFKKIMRKNVMEMRKKKMEKIKMKMRKKLKKKVSTLMQYLFKEDLATQTSRKKRRNLINSRTSLTYSCRNF